MTGLMREMTGLEKLRELAEEIKQGEDRKAIARVREKGGVNALSMGFQDADNRRIELCSSLGIDLETGWADAMAAMRRRLMPEGMEWDGSVLRIRTAENVDYDGETLFVLIGGRDE